MEKKYDAIFCILTYKNFQDLIEFLKSINNILNIKYKIVIVNSYFDKITSNKIKIISKKYNCDFLEVENKGYGAGNNYGINFIKKNYKYDYLIISNADIEIINFDKRNLKNFKNESIIIAPKIINKKGYNQNPMNYRYSYISETLIHSGFKENKKILLNIGIAIIKIIRLLGKIKNVFKTEYQIYCPHGSFIILNKNAIDKLNPIFDEKIFLYGEEGDLAQKCRLKKIKIKYNSKIQVKHKEDGSVGISNFKLENLLKKSQLYYYNKWYKIGREKC